ncbi:arsenate reductase (azurin) small subunit [Consotaella salsifontis]|uniref:Arsenite oxidase small subunit n=1 Tax=Consotaella salsifontis TaxID=1365950 RepID=A0A1T4SF83_9HYPH|nr:arsenate reductase (azurin) small subunit [Consotaella salsifontis]SKA26588.1 arsenite oxidase small subunit [Consotaella salsifontis]
MKRCDRLVDQGRRRFLAGAGLATAGAAATTFVSSGRARAATAPAAALVKYPANRLANVKDLRVGEPFDVSYPDENAPGVLLKLGRTVPGGAGPDGDIVGFSAVCPHKGYPLVYSAGDRSFNCPGHYSRFDPEAGGQQIWGHATQNLPQYDLRVDEHGDIYAEGIDELLYGRLSNVI